MLLQKVYIFKIEAKDKNSTDSNEDDWGDLDKKKIISMNLKKFFSVIFILLLNNNVANSVTYNSNPKIFIEELVQDAVKTLSDNSISEEEKNLAIEKIALENVDIQALGLYTLGNIRKEVDQNTLEMYQNYSKNIFKKFDIKTD